MTESSPNLFVLNPLAIPAWGSGAVRRVQPPVPSVAGPAGDAQASRFRRPINWVFNPAAARARRALGEDRIIYYCVDEYTAFSRRAVGVLDRDGARPAAPGRPGDRVGGATAPVERRRTTPNRPGPPRRRLSTTSASALEPDIREVPDEIAALPRPVIGYFGLMSPDWVDVPLLDARRPALRRRLAGPARQGRRWTSARSPGCRTSTCSAASRTRRCPAYCKGFDVALIPFPVSEVTLNANPLKAREYLAAGLPVVSTPIPEVEVLGQCRIGRSPAEFIQRLEEALKRPGPDRARSESMRSEGWSARLDEVRGHFARLPAPEVRA